MRLPLPVDPRCAPTTADDFCLRPLHLDESDEVAPDGCGFTSGSFTVSWEDPAPVRATVRVAPLWCEHRTGLDDPAAVKAVGGHWADTATTAIHWLHTGIHQAARTLPPSQAALLELLITSPTAGRAHHYALRFRHMTLSVEIRAHGQRSTWTIHHRPPTTTPAPAPYATAGWGGHEAPTPASASAPLPDLPSAS
ncbi:hypothetical protein AB0I22_19450 [Streptomyces sp. NPDC050610]|uniref:hypothetical protein n=1 Tax=Streptomyces sp. NPDC050610 TaxID=3157097 RepID=UPI00342BAE28